MSSTSPSTMGLPIRGRQQAHALGWKVTLDTPVTRAGSAVGDLEWDMRGDHDSLGISIWTASIAVGGVQLGTTADEQYRPLINALQQAVAARWRYATRDDGRQWNAKRVADAIYACQRFVKWMAEVGLSMPEEITEEVLLHWRDAIVLRDDGKRRSSRDLWSRIDPPLLLWRMRSRTDRTIGFEPENPWPEAYVNAEDDTTPIPLIPRPVLEHIIGAACRYVEVYSHDIRDARKYLEQLSVKWEKNKGAPRPIWKRDDPIYSAYDVWLGRRFGWRSAEARKAMGSPAPWNPNGLFADDPDTSEPWIDCIRTRQHLQQLENSLRTACYILIAFMTGARNTEMNQLKDDCLVERKQLDGRPTEYFIRGIVTKNRGQQGQKVEWGVPPIAVKAANLLLEMCTSWRDRTSINRLFVTQTGSKINHGLLNNDIKIFLERVGSPYVGGKPFPLSTHQFRVALAQWLGAEPLGELAGAFHLKQLNTAAFRGYLREDPQFQSLFDAFEAQASADHLAMLLAEPTLGGRKGSMVMASRTPEEQAKLEANVRVLNLAQVGREAPSLRVMEQIKKTGRPVYLTPFSTCIFIADAAECLKGVPIQERKRPATHRCSPLTCANAAITRLQIPAYLEDYESYRQIADDLTSSSSQVDLARREMDVLKGVLYPHIQTFIVERETIERALIGQDEREAETIALANRLRVVNDLLTRLHGIGAVGAKSNE